MDCQLFFMLTVMEAVLERSKRNPFTPLFYSSYFNYSTWKIDIIDYFLPFSTGKINRTFRVRRDVEWIL